MRVLTTHLEYYSKRQRMAQARYLRRMHFEALSQVFAPPPLADDGSPFQRKPRTEHAVLCGDFNFESHELEYAALSSPAAVIECLEAGWPEGVVGAAWNDAWRVLRTDQPQPDTFPIVRPPVWP